MATPTPRRRTTALVLLWVIVMTAVLAASGCYGRNCEGEVTYFGRVAGEGRMVSPDDWESMTWNEKWLPFPRQRVWVIEMKELGPRTPFKINVYLSAQENPGAEDGNLTQGGGNLTEISGIRPGTMTVKNGTCADYYLRVTAEASPLPPAPTASTATDAGTSDADAGP